MATASVDFHLHVETQFEQGSYVLAYDLRSPGGTLRFQPNRVVTSPLHTPNDFIQTVFRHIDLLRKGKDGDGNSLSPQKIAEETETFGRSLALRLFPPELCDAWVKIPPGCSVLITSDEPWIPWEMVKPPGIDYLCMQFRLTRWLPATAPTYAPDPPLDLRITKMILAEAAEVDRYPPLTCAEQEIDFLQGLAAESGVEPQTLREASRHELEGLLRKGGAQWIHIAAHGQVAPKNAEESFLVLKDQKLRARHFLNFHETLQEDRPMIVLSACEIGRSGHALTGLAGWPERCIAGCHAGAFLAPLWSVDDERACFFMECFYSHLRDGQSLGEALWNARRTLHAKAPHDTTWLAWSLYAHPNARIVLGASTPFPERIATEVTEAHEILVAPAESMPELLPLPQLQWEPDLSPPGTLLRADYAVVPFHFRQDELEDLLHWCRSDARIGVRLYVGAGGMGKTRLALQLCKKLRAEGWEAGEAGSECDAKNLWNDLAERGRSRLLLIDYAETRRDFLTTLLREIRRSKEGPVRLILLARAALDWWEQLKNESQGVGEILSGPATKVKRLPALALSPEQRSESYEIAMKAFAEKLGKEIPETGEEKDREDFTDETYERALLLHMSALATIEGVNVRGEDGILDFMLARERGFWDRMAKRRSIDPSLQEGIGRAMTIITLCGGVDDESSAIEVMHRLNSLRDQKTADLLQIARLLSDLYPGHRWIMPVLPDLLGEHLIQREMERGADELFDIVFGEASGS